MKGDLIIWAKYYGETQAEEIFTTNAEKNEYEYQEV